MEEKITKTKNYTEYDWSPVINFETGGRDYYNKFLKKASWPGGQSGITIGTGIDLGYITKQEFDLHLKKFFSPNEVEKLYKVIGLKGLNAKNALPSVSDISFSWENAIEVFFSWILPKFWNMAIKVWPGLEELCEPAQVALVSIIFNRGPSVNGPSRVEMFNIKSLVLKKDYNGIANEVLSMKRLWAGNRLNGLLKRRDSEAKMIRSCA